MNDNFTNILGCMYCNTVVLYNIKYAPKSYTTFNYVHTVYVNNLFQQNIKYKSCV